MHFEDKVALVTGGSSGIGLATARLLSAHRAHVWLAARDRAKLETALAQVEAARVSTGQRCGIAVADVSDAGQAAAAVAQVSEAVGVPDLVFNCAGAAHPGYFQELALDIFHWMMDVNYFGVVNITKAVVPGMIARGSGHIVNISSIAGFLGIFGYTAYGPAKAAVRGFSDVLRAEMKPLGIRVSVVFPPDCDTPSLAYEKRFNPVETQAISDMGKCMSPEAVATEILHGVARGRYIILPGSEGKLLYRLTGLIGGGVYPIMDWIIARARHSQQRG